MVVIVFAESAVHGGISSECAAGSWVWVVMLLVVMAVQT